MVSLEKQRAVGGLNLPTASIRVSETTLHLPFTAAVSGPPNVPNALVRFQRTIIVIRNGQILSRDMILLCADVKRKLALRRTMWINIRR